MVGVLGCGPKKLARVARRDQAGLASAGDQRSRQLRPRAEARGRIDVSRLADAAEIRAPGGGLKGRP